MLLLALAVLYWTKSSPLTHTHTHTRLTALFPGLPRWAGTRKVNAIWILLKQETVSGSGISWAICKSAPRSRKITMPAPHHSVFYRPDALPANSVKALKAWTEIKQTKTQQTCSAASVYCWLFHSHSRLWSVTKNTHTFNGDSLDNWCYPTASLSSSTAQLHCSFLFYPTVKANDMSAIQRSKPCKSRFWRISQQTEMYHSRRHTTVWRLVHSTPTEMGAFTVNEPDWSW